MTRNFTIFLLALLLCACAKDETPEIIRASYDTPYQEGKTYVQTFCYSDTEYPADDSKKINHIVKSLDSRLETKVESGTPQAPGDVTITTYFKYVNKGGLDEGVSYKLVVDYKFTCGGFIPGPALTYRLDKLWCVSRWRLVTAKSETYTFEGKTYERLVILEELQQSPLEPPKDDEK